MIERMHKYLFLVYHKEYEVFLHQLRSLGVVHIKENKNAKQFEELQSLLSVKKELAILTRQVKSRRSKEAPEIMETLPATIEEGKKISEEIVQLFKEEEHLLNQVASQKRDIAYWNIWGEYSIELLHKLRDQGYPVRFYVVPSQQYQEEWETTFRAVRINDLRAQTYFITIGETATEERIEAEEIKAPKYTIAEKEEQLALLEQELQNIRTKIQIFADNRIGELQGYDLLLSRQYDFSNALLQANAEAEDTLMLLEGWVPEKISEEVTKGLATTSCYFKQVEIEENDTIPVKLSNNRYARLFEPITKMYSLPNYGEIDITALFAPFFMLFFALCFGDGGYGLLLLLGATFAKIKTKSHSVKSLCSMMQWLGGTTAIVGSLMGTVFGMVMPWAGDNLLGSVSNDYFLNQDNMMALAVVLGLIQIVFGKFIAGYKTQKQRGFKYGLSSYAWAMLILFGALGYVTSMLSASQGDWAKAVSQVFFGIAAVSFLIALFYNTPGKNIFLNLGSGLWATYNNASGLLGDTLSYIRLFAIGLTGGILGGVFNNLAVQIGGDLPVGLNFIVMGIILLFGHGLNFGLCMISSLVHPLRLTFVEFYKNAEFEGGGREYKPFKL
ncbi:V-type ATP synthase subunit I [Porphyromonas gingivicanis]|uniref:V-type ATP synthase subunit I n=1 Tax=Porphyromonas gingivicanis TaxID=266762 RepID=UPI00046FA8C0|nr:V-type ATPase 116kDa subunit family protein [Porphyromonas gingivicanis]